MPKQGNLYPISDLQLAVKLSTLFPIRVIDIYSKEYKVIFNFSYSYKLISAIAKFHSGIFALHPGQYEKGLKELTQAIANML